MDADRVDVEFRSGNELCRAWLFRPKKLKSVRVPCVVMAHGFGATKDGGLEPYARRFAEDGYFALVFDYRHFGTSEGEPRQLLSIPEQLADYQAALDFARRLPQVNPRKVALWGSSFSGGHVVVAGARDGRVAAISSQCPMMDGLESAMIASQGHVGGTLMLGAHGLWDLTRALFGASPHTIPIVAAPGHTAAMSAPDADPGYRAILPKDFTNAVAARITLQLGSYRPFQSASKLPCPILIQICEKDSVAPPNGAEKAAKKAGARAEVKRYPVGHFDVYLGEAFEQSIADQQAFFAKHLWS